MEIVNKVQQSGIEVLSLDALSDGAPVTALDLSPFLVEGLVLREKVFRERVEAYDWALYEGHHVAVFCATDAIVPTWAYLLVASKLTGARSVVQGSRADAQRAAFGRALDGWDWGQYQDRIVVIKGCGSDAVPLSAYVDAMAKLMPVARKVMYGEPCSNVPLWRRKR